MESQNLETITSELQRQKNLVHQKAAALRSDLWTVEKDLARIDAALAALSGEATQAPSNGIATKRSKRSVQTRSAKKSDVVGAMVRLLQKEEVMPADALKKQVETLLSEEGFNRFGFAMRWKEACQDSQFLSLETGFRLADHNTVRLAEAAPQIALSTSTPTIVPRRSGS